MINLVAQTLNFPEVKAYQVSKDTAHELVYMLNKRANDFVARVEYKEETYGNIIQGIRIVVGRSQHQEDWLTVPCGDFIRIREDYNFPIVVPFALLLDETYKPPKLTVS